MITNPCDITIRVRGNSTTQERETFIKAMNILAEGMGFEVALKDGPVCEEEGRSYSKIRVSLWKTRPYGARIFTFNHVTGFKQISNKIEFWYPKRRKSGVEVLTHVTCYGECLFKAEEAEPYSTVFFGKRGCGMSAWALGIPAGAKLKIDTMQKLAVLSLRGEILWHANYDRYVIAERGIVAFFDEQQKIISKVRNYSEFEVIQ